MGSLESVPSLKRDHKLLRSSSSFRNNNSSFNSSRSRSRFARLVLCKKIDYLLLICGVAVFFFYVFLFQRLHLPGSVTEDGDNSGKFKGTHDFISGDDEENLANLTFLKELDFGQDLKFEPLKIMEKFQKGANAVRESVGSEKAVRFGYRKPKLALVWTGSSCSSHGPLLISDNFSTLGFEVGLRLLYLTGSDSNS
ncbi:glycosyl transferase family 1 protein [Striga asiatica]|uniref:Glycosyl transferase family 1 protein n=1 Tax=Striga asiatica TaxID=4170 RepID=A0A5A7P3C4_STRAF|nr:glycosyl transferase family 1 protein [Striga asiatica]